jgi:hypothetical protein
MTEDFFHMTSHRPYLLRALVEWINDNQLTPHILVDAGVPGVQVPPSAVKDGRVVLNIAERAVVRLMIDNEDGELLGPLLRHQLPGAGTDQRRAGGLCPRDRAGHGAAG